MASLSKPVSKESDTAKATKPFRLLDLPPELWLRICELAVDAVPPLDSITIWNAEGRVDRRDPHVRERTRTSIAAYNQPEITKVCRALGQELLPYYYATKVDIAISGFPWFYKRFPKWLGAVGLAKMDHIPDGLKAHVNPDSGGSWKSEALRFWGLEVEMEFVRLLKPEEEALRRVGAAEFKAKLDPSLRSLGVAQEIVWDLSDSDI